MGHPRRIALRRVRRRQRVRINPYKGNKKVSEQHKVPADVATPSRRNLLFMIGAAFNAVAGVLVAIPLVGYIFSAFAHKRIAPEQWINLGEVTLYPTGQTRLATYRNPFTRPWDGPTADIPCWVRRLNEQKF